MIIGTAGHIDHGKSSLVTALTGRAMDRLAEERRRGITIDLNFAPLELGPGRVAGIVDVPGHEDFVRTMVAGASGIDVALLVVAADESIRKSSDPLAVARAGAADLLVIKAQPLGGVTHALQIVTAAGLPAVVSSALDTAVGLSQGAALAAALPSLEYDCGLGTASLFLDDVADLRPMDGSIPAGRVVPDAAALIVKAGLIVLAVFIQQRADRH